ncbi:MAG: gliding motility-associated C-terminal domain-containing protein, partial [Bacteroidota bacterium]
IIATVLSLPTQTMMLDLSACPGGSATFNGVPIATGASQTFNFSNQFGCDSNVVVTVLALPEDTTQVELGACSGATVDFNGQQLSPGEQGNWLGVNQFGCDSLVQATVIELPHTVLFVDGVACENSFLEYQGQQIFPGQHVIFTQVNASGCLDTTIVAVLGLPVDSTSAALFACPGSPVAYAGQQLMPGFEGYFTFTNLSGCDSVVQVSVAASPPVDFLLTATQICPDSTNGEIMVGSISGSTAPYTFSMDGQNFQPEPVFENLPPGSYKVLLQDANGCQFEQSAVLPTYAPMFVTAPEELLFCADSVQLSPQVVSTQLPASLTWQDGSTLPIFWATTPGEYVFTASNQCQEIEGSISVDYDLSVPPPQIYVPNAFSPNADGFNDCFRGYAASDVKLLGYQLKVFDRWGNFLFETSELEGCWDGKFRGKLIDPAVVVWFLTYQYENCAGEAVEVFREGGVQVLR